MNKIQNPVLYPISNRVEVWMESLYQAQSQYLQLPQDLSQQCDEPTVRQDKVKIHKTFVMYSSNSPWNLELNS